jgi:hypothetical protein
MWWLYVAIVGVIIIVVVYIGRYSHRERDHEYDSFSSVFLAAAKSEYQ